MTRAMKPKSRQGNHDGPHPRPRIEEADLPANRIYEVAVEQPLRRTIMRRFVVSLVLGLLLGGDPSPSPELSIYVQRRDDRSVICSVPVRMAGKRDAIVELFQDDLARLTVAEFFRRHVG